MATARIFTHPVAARERFRALVEAGEPGDLSEAALVIALEQYPALEIDSYLEQVEAWSTAIRSRVGGSEDVDRLVSEINRLLFEEEGFHGEAGDYYDPKNTFLNEVIDHHAGLPIALSIIYLEVSRRAGLRTIGVSIPGHFLVCLSGPWGEILIDPFDGGRVLTRDECQGFLDRLYGGGIRLREQHIRSFDDREILGRLLSHLKAMYIARGDLSGAVSALDRLLILDQGDVWDIRDRGLLEMQLHRYREAIEDLRRYLEMVPYAEDAGRIRDEIDYLEGWLNRN